MNSDTQRVMFSTGKDNWGTPLGLFGEQHLKHQFTVDGAADESNHLLQRWWGPGGEREDALGDEPWGLERVWINPPYSRGLQGRFVDRAVMEVRYGKVERVVMLLPARTDTKVFHELIYDQRLRLPRPWVREVEFLRGRLKFRNPEGPLLRGTSMNGSNDAAPFPSMIVWFQL